MSIGRRTARYTFGVSILLAHFGTMIVYVWLGSGKADGTSIIQGILSVAPVSALYVATFIRYVSANPLPAPDESGHDIGIDAFLVQASVIYLFCGALILLPVSVFVSGWFDPDKTPVLTGAIDTLFGVYLAAIYERLFPLEWKPSTP